MSNAFYIQWLSKPITKKGRYLGYQPFNILFKLNSAHGRLVFPRSKSPAVPII